MELTVSTRTSNRVTLCLLVLLFALPPILGWMFFLNPQWLPDKHSNNGELVHPARSITDLGFYRTDGRVMKAEDFSNAWRRIIVAKGACGEACQGLIAESETIRRALGANQQHIKTMLVILPDMYGFASIDGAGAGYKAIEVAQVPDASLPALDKRFQLHRYPVDHYSFMVDPMGALMMTYNHKQLTTKEMLGDMETLMKISQDWIKGAQYGHK